MEEAEEIVKEVQAPTHKGPYGDVTGVPASGLYKRYESWYTKKHDGSTEGMLPFSEWLYWAKEQGLVVQKKAAAQTDTPVEAPRHEEGSLEQNLYQTNRRVAGLLFVTSAIFLLINAASPSQ
ncbi:MAG: hypothetical protein COA79_20300 [Planctomycetota bacterium]|nr:MAG: hypothetical protein COA79_20300 [Planctomycetota bacterium]